MRQHDGRLFLLFSALLTLRMVDVAELYHVGERADDLLLSYFLGRLWIFALLFCTTGEGWVAQHATAVQAVAVYSCTGPVVEIAVHYKCCNTSCYRASSLQHTRRLVCERELHAQHNKVEIRKQRCCMRKPCCRLQNVENVQAIKHFNRLPHTCEAPIFDEHMVVTAGREGSPSEFSAFHEP